MVVFLLSLSVRASNTPISDAAYPLLFARTFTNQQVFYVYQNADSGLNHGFPSGFYGAISNLQINAACVDDTNSPDGCSTNLNIFDRQRGNVIQIEFAPLSGQEFVGINFEEPQDWGTLQTGRGYDLTGANEVVLSVRSPTPGGITVLLGVAETNLEYVYVPQSTNYTLLTLSLAPIPPTSLTNVHVLFSIGTDAGHAPNGGILLVDYVQFLPTPSSQNNVLGFPLSTETFGVVPYTAPAPGLEPFPLDQVLRNLTAPYESSIVLMALLDRGTPSDLAAAHEIADAFVYALGHENHGDPLPSTNGFASLHNGYEDGDLALFNGQGVGAGQQGDIRLAGFSCGSSSPNGFCVVQDGATGGNDAFAILALASAYKRFGNISYLQAAEEIGCWITAELKDNSGTGFGGYFAGYPDEGQAKVLIQGKSTENNADIFAAFTVLAGIEQQLGNSSGATGWTSNANFAGDFVMRMFDPTRGCFYAGTATNGTPVGLGEMPNGPQQGNDVINTFNFLDVNTFTTLGMAGAPRYRTQIDWRLPVQFITNNFAKTVTSGGNAYSGFSLQQMPTVGPDGIAWEFTGQVVVTMNFVDALYGVTQFASSATNYLAQIRFAQTNAPFGDGNGVVASVVQGGDTLPPIEQSLNTAFQNIPERVGLAATTWAILAEENLNPLALNGLPPLLKIQLTNSTGVIISWAALPVGFRLEQNLTLEPTQWVSNSNLVNCVNGTNAVIIESLSHNTFFRLIYP